MSARPVNIWVYLQAESGALKPECLGLIPEARRLVAETGGEGRFYAVAQGMGLKNAVAELGGLGVDKVIYQRDEELERYGGELFCQGLADLITRHAPSHVLMAQSPETLDLAARLAARLKVPLITRAMDYRIDKDREIAVRPVASGYLFEALEVVGPGPAVVNFPPAVLSEPEAGVSGQVEIVVEKLDRDEWELRTRVLETIEADPGSLNLEEADLIVAAGRGVGKGEGDFAVIEELAQALGASIGATRPVVDWGVVPYERQIGQTGKVVAPRLIINCGISGANEYTSGMDKSQAVVAINTDERARMFKFADLGVVGDLHQIIPALIERADKGRES